MADDSGTLDRRTAVRILGASAIGVLFGNLAASGSSIDSLKPQERTAVASQAVTLYGPDGRPLPGFTPSNPGYFMSTGRVSLGTLCAARVRSGPQPPVSASGEAALLDVECKGTFSGILYGRKSGRLPWRPLICVRLDDASLDISAGEIRSSGSYEADIAGYTEVYFDLRAVDGTNAVTIA